jgi:hypothetical protein
MAKNNKNRYFLKVFIGIAVLGFGLLLVLLKSRENRVSLQEENTAIEIAQHNIEGLPGDFPIYENAKFVTFAKSEDGLGRSYIWETEDETSLVFEYLKSQLRIGGWVLSFDSSVGSSSSVSFEKEENAGFLGVFKGGSGETIISVSIRKP